MSRVFDALNRASEERKKAVKASEGPGAASEGKNAAPESPASNGNSTSVFLGDSNGTSNLEDSSRLQQPDASNFEQSSNLEQRDVSSRSWRDSLENILFGWNVSRFQSHPVVALEKDSAVAEQYKILREHLTKLRADTGARCISVTSPVQRDGKTTVAVNLAAAMALEYEGKVLLIDGDLRRPEVHRYFSIQPSPGLGDYLSASGNGSLMTYFRETSIPGFQIIPGGKPTSLSSELLAKQKMKILLDEICVRFPEHWIILDAPPVLSTPDPLVLGRHVDGILMVVRAGKTPRDSLVKAVQSLNSTKVLGIVLNGVDLRSSSNYYYSYHSSKND